MKMHGARAGQEPLKSRRCANPSTIFSDFRLNLVKLVNQFAQLLFGAKKSNGFEDFWMPEAA